jgi:hypothetical protein
MSGIALGSSTFLTLLERATGVAGDDRSWANFDRPARLDDQAIEDLKANFPNL